MKIAVLFLVALVLELGCVAWMFVTLLKSGSNEVSEEEAATIHEELVDDLGTAPESDAAVVAVGVMTTVRIAPFPGLLPGFHLSPHRSACVVGLVGIALTVGAATWCTVVPKVTFEGTVSTEELPAEE